MIIDFHTHAFPDALAAKALSALSASMKGVYQPVHDGTIGGLLANMDAWNIGASVVLPVVTKPSQTKRANEWAAGVSSERLIGFGGIYPHTPDYKEEIDYAAGLGLKGLKFHAEFQDFFVDDARMLRIYDYALSKGLILIHHAGFDPSFAPPFKSTPQRFANVIRAMPGGTIVLAHLGGHDQWDDVEEYLAGGDAYLDTSMGFEYFSEERFLRIVRKHGAQKILFASDAPWSVAGAEIERIRSLPLAQEEKDAILGGNAKRLLNLD